jgi:hypothetical protein
MVAKGCKSFFESLLNNITLPERQEQEMSPLAETPVRLAAIN